MLEETLVRAIAMIVWCSTVYYVFARAEITRPIWSRYSRFFDKLARCPACSGLWIGAIYGVLTKPPYQFGAGYPFGAWLDRMSWSMAWGMFLTPIGAWLLLHALSVTSIPDDSV